MFGWGKRQKDSAGKSVGEAERPAAEPRVLATLDAMQKSGVQLAVRFGRSEIFLSSVVGLGREAFFIDTFTPPTGDALALPGAPIGVESLMGGTTLRFSTRILGKVEFLDELPAFKIEYPAVVVEEKRRKSPRIVTGGTASISFLEPFRCDATVVDISETGFAFEYGAHYGKLRAGTRLSGALLEIGARGVMTVEAEVVETLVASLGGLSLPRTYRAGARLVGVSVAERARIKAYMQDIQSLSA